MLDKKYIRELRDAINSSPIFYEESRYIEKYNLTCAVMERLETSVGYLTAHIHKPKTEEDFLIFMMFACMVVDASKELLKCYNQSLDIEDEQKFFYHAYGGNSIITNEENYPTDDNFFAYFRSLTFAHPYETSRAKFIPKGEKQYSPWVIVNGYLSGLYTSIENAVGVKIYFNNRPDSQKLYVSFDMLLEYIQNRYERIQLITESVRVEVSRIEEEWAKYQIDCTHNDIEDLYNIKKELSRRYADTNDIDILISFMSCQCSNNQNTEIVEAYRKEVRKAIPKMIDEVNNFKVDIGYITSQFFHRIPSIVHPSCSYELEKIFNYLSGEQDLENINWGLEQTDSFADKFAKKWVVILPWEMNFDEIKLLVTIACIFESNEQEKNKI